MSFQFQRLRIPDVILIEPQKYRDARGFFLETYKMSSFSANGIPQSFIQDNLSHSARGVLRGLHYQKHPRAQGKLVIALRGRIFDVAVDIRKGSASYGQWVGLELSAESSQMLYVPVGFAHGFCVLSKEADVLYKVTAEYCPDLDRGLAWNDPQIGIQWPVGEPLLSAKDAGLPTLAQADNNFEMA